MTDIKICEYCGKPYKLFSKTIQGKVHNLYVADCTCENDRQNEIEQRIAKEKQNEKLKKTFDNSLMTPLFKEKTFKNLDETPETLELENYAKNFDPKKSMGILMIGNVGTGKTTLMAAICNHLMINNYTCLFTTLSTLLDKFSSYSYNNAGDITHLLMWLTKFDFIVLDDLGREAYNEKRKEIAFRIVDTLLNYKKVVGITANPDMIDKLKHIPEWEATLDRIKDICGNCYEFHGESKRGRK
jgi:DNA replication protein DnaC